MHTIVQHVHAIYYSTYQALMNTRVTEQQITRTFQRARTRAMRQVAREIVLSLCFSVVLHALLLGLRMAGRQ